MREFCLKLLESGEFAFRHRTAVCNQAVAGPDCSGYSSGRELVEAMMTRSGIGITAVGVVALVAVGWFDGPSSKASGPALISPDGHFNAATNSCSDFTSWTAAEGVNLKNRDAAFLRAAFRSQAAGLSQLDSDDDSQFNGWLGLVTLACLGVPDTAFSSAGQNALQGMVQMAQGAAKMKEDTTALGAVNNVTGSDSDSENGE